MPTLTADADRVVAWLRTVRLCDGLDFEQLASIAGKISVQPFVAGETLASAGDAVTEFWILVEGELDSFVTDPRGREKWLVTVRQGETIGEIVILEGAPNRPVRFTARTHGTLLVAPAESLREWVKAYPQMMQNLFQTLSKRFSAVAGVRARNLPSPRLGVVATSPRGYVLAGRLAARLLAAGERLRVWTGQPSSLTSTGNWPEALPVHELAASDSPLLQPPTPEIDRQIVVWSFVSDGGSEFTQLRGCDEILWLLEPSDAAYVRQDLDPLKALQGELAKKVRIVWLLDADTPVAPLVSGEQFKLADVKVAIESTGSVLTRRESQGLDRLVRALRVFLGGPRGAAGQRRKRMGRTLGVLRYALEEAGLSFDIMSGTNAGGAMAGILLPPRACPPQQAIEQAFQHDLTPGALVRYMAPKWPNWYLVAQYRRRAWDGMLRKYLHDWRLEQLSIPFNAVTVDLVQVCTVVRKARGCRPRLSLESINFLQSSQGRFYATVWPWSTAACSTICQPMCLRKAASTLSSGLMFSEPRAA